MPALSSKQIVAALEDAFTDAGASAVLIPSASPHPRKFYVVAGESNFPVWIYVWTLTHGGGAARPTDEYRIQLTSVAAPLPQNPDGPTLLLGYEPSLRCFAGFDLCKHHTFTQGSPSIQININTLRAAVRDGFAFSRKGNEEVAIGFRPDNILSYASNVERLHESGSDARLFPVLRKVTEFEDLTDAETESIPPERKRVVAEVTRLARDSAFRRKVTVAYDRMCAVTGLQLRLIEAAHILPVGVGGSTDEVSNGICLSPTYHTAYDRGLIYLTDDRRMVINGKKKRELLRLGLARGLPAFEATLGREIFLPSDKRQWPNVELIRQANLVRKVI